MRATMTDFNGFINELKDGMQDYTNITLLITDTARTSTATIYGIDLNTIDAAADKLTINNPHRYHDVTIQYDGIEYADSTPDIDGSREQSHEWTFAADGMTASLIFEISA